MEIKLVCQAHGPMRNRPEGWFCLGFDGEGCANDYVSHDTAWRLATGETYWPGVEVTISYAG